MDVKEMDKPFVGTAYWFLESAWSEWKLYFPLWPRKWNGQWYWLEWVERRASEFSIQYRPKAPNATHEGGGRGFIADAPARCGCWASRPGKDKDMKARLVTDIRAQDAQPGDIELRTYPDGHVGGYAYRCPGCGQEDYLPVDDGTRGWTRAGPTDAPTLRPSILHRPCGWHGYLTDGEFAPC